jgi:eukaryotic-like serine/threonine-protein kinase
MDHPQRLGKYPITGVLGQGAMGVVYRGIDPVIQRPVAIKTVHKQLLNDDDPTASFAARFRNEAQAAGRISHPGIVAVYEYGEDEHDAYIVMEYVEGRTLGHWMSANPQPSEAQVLDLMEQLLDALGFAHAQGVWHRDIKPANLIVTPTGRLKVTDFGIARIQSIALTQANALIGTPGYMAPEQYTGADIDHRVDLFAAGVLLYRLLAGRAPFSGSAETVMYQILNEQPAAPSTLAPRSPAFDPLVAQALAKQPQARFDNAEAFRAALRAVAGRAAQGDDAERTRVLPPVRSVPVAPSGTLLGSPGSSPGSSPGTTPTGSWDAKTLAPVEAALATLIGPMAKVLVRQAARRSNEFGPLVDELAAHIGEPQSRKAFLARFASVRGATTSPGTSAVIAAAGLPPEVVDHATRVLTKHVGPIARILVKKASARAESSEHLFQLLAEDTAVGADREQLLKKLRGG